MNLRGLRQIDWGGVAAYTILSVYSCIVVFPLFWAFTNSLKTKVQMRDYSYIFRFTPTLEHYRTLFRVQEFWHLMLNSMVVAAATMAITVPVAFGAAYALVRWPWRGGDQLTLAILATRMLPPISLILPIYTLFRIAHLLNTRLGLTIAYITFALPFAIWMLRGYLQSLPKDYEESAQIDGLTQVSAVFKIVLPISSPAVFTSALFVALSAWSEFLFALILTVDKQAETAPVGVAGLVSALGVEWGQLLAASSLLMIPMVVLVLFAQRYLVEGLTASLK
jgi:ABC-type glycerol-3-phosphate transport system permease component